MVRKQRSRSGNSRKGGRLKRNSPLDFTERESRLQQKRKRTRFILLSTIVLLIVFVAGLYWAVTANISDIKVNAADTENNFAEEVQALSRQYLEKTSSKTLFVDEDGLKQYLTVESPRIKSADVSTNYLRNSLSIVISERTPELVLQSKGMQFYIDSDGVAFLHRAEKEQSELPLIIDESSITVPEGDQVVSDSFVTFVTTAHNSLEAMGQQIKFYKTTGVTKNIIATTSENTSIIFDVDQELNNQIQKLEQALKHIEQQNIKVQRIDLRTDNKAFIE